MFRRLANLFRRGTAMAFPPLQDHQRVIFRYWDGEKETGCDPIVALIAMERDDEFRFDVHPAGVDAGDAEATQVMARMIGRVFLLPDFDPATGRGLTVAERLDLYSAFCGWVDALKKNGNPTLTPPPAMAATSSD